MKSMYVQEAVRKAKLRDGKSNRQIALVMTLNYSGAIYI